MCALKHFEDLTLHQEQAGRRWNLPLFTQLEKSFEGGETHVASRGDRLLVFFMQNFSWLRHKVLFFLTNW